MKVLLLLGSMAISMTCYAKTQVSKSSHNVSSPSKQEVKYWRFVGNGKTSPVKGLKFQQQGYNCQVKRIDKLGKLIGKEINIQSLKQVTVGAMLKKVESELKLPRIFNENKGNIKNIGTSLPVYQVLSDKRDMDYLAACGIWIQGKLLYLGEPPAKK